MGVATKHYCIDGQGNHTEVQETVGQERDMAVPLLTLMLMIAYVHQGGKYPEDFNHQTLGGTCLLHLLCVFIFSGRFQSIASLQKSTAADFLQPVREKRSAECFPAGCSMESENESQSESQSEEEGPIEVDASYVSSVRGFH